MDPMFHQELVRTRQVEMLNEAGRVHLAAKATTVNEQPKRLRLARAGSLDCRAVARQGVATYGEGMRRLLRGWIWFRVWWHQAPQIN